MAANNMLTLYVRLNAQPGTVVPELHLKQGMTSIEVKLFIETEGTLDALGKAVVIKGKLPDGKDLFFTAFTSSEEHLLIIRIPTNSVQKMAVAAGTYKCTATILKTTVNATRKTYMNYDFLTVLPFTVVVHESA